MLNPGDRLFDIDVTAIDIPTIEVSFEAVGALQTQRHSQLVSTLADEANYYATAAQNYANANAQIDSAHDQALLKEATERAARDFALQQAAYAQTLAKLRASKGI